MKALKFYLFLLMWPRPDRLKEKCLIYFPDVSPWRFKISAVFPTMLQLNDGGQQGSFLCPYMILIILRAEGVQFSS